MAKRPSKRPRKPTTKKRSRSARSYKPLSTLRLDDIRARRPTTPSKLMNVQIPDTVAAGIARIAKETGATKTDVIIALLNEGLDAAEG